MVSSMGRRWLQSIPILGALALVSDVPEVTIPCGMPRSTDPETVIARCAARPWYRLTRLERLALAQAYVRVGQNDDAELLAPTLPLPDALHVTGHAAFNRDDPERGSELLLRAAIMHAATSSPQEAARAFHLRAGIRRGLNDFGGALLDAGACTRMVARVGGRIAGFCHLALARVFYEVGHVDAALDEFAVAMPLLATDHDRAWAVLERGNLQQEIERHALAVLDFETALRLSKEPRLVRGAHLNAAFSRAALAEPDAAERHLQAVEPTGADYLAVAGRVAQVRGERAQAREYFGAALRTETEPAALVWIAIHLAELEHADGDRAGEAKYLRLAIQRVEAMRARERLELRPWLLTAGRTSYERLFVLLVESGDPVAATHLAAHWLGRTALEARALAIHRPRHASVAYIAEQLNHVAQLPPVAAESPGLQLRSDEDLLVLVVAAERVWRIVVSGGEPRIEPVGDLTSVRGWIARVESDRTSAARALGAALLSPAVAYRSSRPLVVVADPLLGWIDVGGLEMAGSSLLALRPVVYRVALARRPETGRNTASHTVAVFGDSGSDLIGARLEALMVGRILDVTPRLGPEVTREALLSAGSYDVVHIAGHTRFVHGVAALETADGLVTFYDIVNAPRVPRVVVLSVCAGAAASDGEGFAALTTAFLIAGSEVVIASDRSVVDGDMLVAMLQFYRMEGWRDPIRAVRDTRHAASGALAARSRLFVFQSL